MRLKALTVLATALFAGCLSDDGGQSGDFSGDDGQQGGETANGCKDTETPVDGSDASELGFSADNVLAAVEQRYGAPLSWQAVDGVSYTPGSGDADLTLTVSGSGEAFYVTSAPIERSGGGEIALATSCPPPRLRVAVDVELETSDGALAETFAATVDASSPLFANLQHRFALDQLAGAFSVESITPEGSKLLGLSLTATLSAGGMTGNLASTIETTYPADDPLEGAVSARSAVFASWPASASCPADEPGSAGIPVALDDDAFGLSGEAALGRYNDASPLALRWNGGSETELSLTAAAAGDGCLRPNPYVLGPDDPEAVVIYPVTLTAVSVDGALDGIYDATLKIWPTEEGAASRVLVEVTLPLEPGAVEASGLGDVELPGDLDRVSFSLRSEVDGDQANGVLALTGFSDPPCLTDPPEPQQEPGGGMSSPGCPGSEISELRAATWGSGSVD